MYDIHQVRADFPILSRTIYDKPLIYLDNGATSISMSIPTYIEAYTGSPSRPPNSTRQPAGPCAASSTPAPRQR